MKTQQSHRGNLQNKTENQFHQKKPPSPSLSVLWSVFWERVQDWQNVKKPQRISREKSQLSLLDLFSITCSASLRQLQTSRAASAAAGTRSVPLEEAQARSALSVPTTNPAQGCAGSSLPGRTGQRQGRLRCSCSHVHRAVPGPTASTLRGLWTVKTSKDVFCLYSTMYFPRLHSDVAPLTGWAVLNSSWAWLLVTQTDLSLKVGHRN